MNEGFDLCPPKVQAPLRTEPFHTWRTAGDAVWLAFHRTGTDILLRFPELADFSVAADGMSISCTPAPDTDSDTIQHLFLNQVLPLALSARGLLSFHASAVTIKGVAVAFIGSTGRGKSTLAASFASHGNAFLTDDGLTVLACGERYMIEPSHPSVRLWADSEGALFTEQSAPVLPTAYSSKSRFPAGGDFRHCATPQPLRAFFFIGTGEAERIAIQPLQPAGAMIELLSNSFRLDVEDRVALGRQFADVARLCDHVPGFRLDYPRRYEALPAVREAVAAAAGSLGQP